MKIRLFGNTECESCIYAFVLINKAQINCEYIDALDDDEDIQNLCDEYDVDDLPYIQFLNDNNDIVVDHIGEISEDEFMNYLATYFPNY